MASLRAMKASVEQNAGADAQLGFALGWLAGLLAEAAGASGRATLKIVNNLCEKWPSPVLSEENCKKNRTAWVCDLLD